MKSLGEVTEAQQNGSDINLRSVIISAHVPLVLAFKMKWKKKWMEWLNGDERWRADIGKKERKEIMRWDEEMDRRNDWKWESLAWPELCDAMTGIRQRKWQQEWAPCQTPWLQTKIKIKTSGSRMLHMQLIRHNIVFFFFTVHSIIDWQDQFLLCFFCSSFTV